MYHAYNMQSSLIIRSAPALVADRLRDAILSGEFPGGSRLEEVQLSASLGVSRTPVREALIILEAQGWVKKSPNRGAVVVPLNARLVDEIYPILAALESEAVACLGEEASRAVDELRDINQRLKQARTRSRQYQLDTAFHRRLVCGCGNSRMLELIEDYRALADRFNGAERRGTANHSGSCAEHDAIVEALSKGNLEKAPSLLREHWHKGMEVVKQWLAA